MNILLTGAWRQAEKHIPEIQALGHDVLFMQNENDNLPCSYDWVEGVVCNGLFLYHDIERFENLKHIQLTSAGFDRVPIGYIKANNIAIYNASDVYSTPISEYVLASVLHVYKQIEFFRENQRKGVWCKNRDVVELNGKKVCIVGCGNVGKKCAKLFSAFGCEVYGVNRTVKDCEYFTRVLPLTDLKDAIAKADIVVLSIALSDETRHLIDSEIIRSIKTDAVLINVSRGAIIDTDALINALREKSFYAILDVFESEPLDSSSPLWNMKNVIVTPHNSFVGNGNEERLYSLFMKDFSDATK